MRHFVGVEHRSVRHIVNAINQTLSLPWAPRRRHGEFSCDFTMFVGMVSGFLGASIDLKMMEDAELDTVIKYIFDSEEELSASYSREAFLTLSEPGICFLRSAEEYFQQCFLGYPPDKHAWFMGTALGLMMVIARRLFPVEAIESVP